MSNPSVYKELYQYDNKHRLVMNEITGDVFISKTLAHYDYDVYRFLYEHHNRHIPRIIDFYKDGDKLVVIEEYIRGDTFDVVINDPDLSDEKKLNYFIELCDGLEFLHNAPHPVIHRDLKPSNILVSEGGRVIIIDYDAAKTYKADRDQDTTFLGTEGRAAPEQYGFMQSDARTDIYALGTMIRDAFPDNRKYQKIAKKAMSFDPEDRYDTVRELKDAMTGRIGLDSKLKSLWPPPGFRTRSWGKICLALIGYPLLFFIAIGVKTKDGTPSDQFIIRMLFGIYELLMLDMCTSWTGMFDSVPLINHSNIIVRYVIKFIYSIIGIFVMMFVYVILSDIVRHFWDFMSVYFY